MILISIHLYFYFLFLLLLTLIYTLFPTRRSSDLKIELSGTELVFALSITCLAVLIFGLWPALQSSKPDLQGTLKEADRKSTRLNSSHGYISYAVFCLKKKKNE